VTGSTPGLDLSFGVDGTLGAVVWLAAFVALTVAVVPVHELVHGLVMRALGARPRYGVGLVGLVLPVAYATADETVDRNGFVAVLLAPLVAITAVGALALPFVGAWLVVPLAANAGGAVGDRWMALTVLRYPWHVAIGDDASGLTVYGRPGDRSLGEAPDHPVWRAIAATGVTFLALVVGAFLSPTVLGAAGIETFALAVPGLGELVAVRADASGFELSVRPDTARLASVVVGVVTTAVSVAVGGGRRGRRGGSTTPPASGPGTQPK
jgi:hypothetical protein